MSIEQFLQKKGIAKNKNQANSIMVIVIIICLVYIFSNIFGGKKSNTELTETEREEVEMMMLMEEEYYPTDETNFELQDSSKNSASNGGYIDL